jgi:hypothetical protein
VIAALDDLVVVVLRRQRLQLPILGRQQQLANVVGVVLEHIHRPAEQQHAELQRRKQPHRVEARLDLLERLLAIGPALGDEYSRPERRQPALDPWPRRVHVLDDERLFAGEVALQPLVRGSRVEDRGVEVRRKAEGARLEPLLIVGADFGEALGPAEVDGAKADRRRARARGFHQLLGILDVGQWVLLGPFALDRRVAFPARVRREALAPEGVLPIDRHLAEGLRLRRNPVLPIAVTDHREPLVDRTELDPHERDGRGLAPRRVAAAGHQQLAAHFGHRLVEDPSLPPKRAGGERPEIDLGHQLLRDAEAEAAEHGHDQPRRSQVLERAMEHAQLARLDRLHGRMQKA